MTTIGRGSSLGATIDTSELEDGAVTPAKASTLLRQNQWWLTNHYRDTAGTTAYAPLMGVVPASGPSTVELENRCRIPGDRPGKFTRIHVMPSGALAAGNSVTITLMQNGVATGLAVTLDDTSVAAQVVTTSLEVATVGGDSFSLRLAFTGGSGVNKGFTACLTWEPT